MYNLLLELLLCPPCIYHEQLSTCTCVGLVILRNFSLCMTVTCCELCRTCHLAILYGECTDEFIVSWHSIKFNDLTSFYENAHCFIVAYVLSS